LKGPRTEVDQPMGMGSSQNWTSRRRANSGARKFFKCTRLWCWLSQLRPELLVDPSP